MRRGPADETNTRTALPFNVFGIARTEFWLRTRAPGSVREFFLPGPSRLLADTATSAAVELREAFRGIFRYGRDTVRAWNNDWVRP